MAAMDVLGGEGVTRAFFLIIDGRFPKIFPENAKQGAVTCFRIGNSSAH
jgi:hypothetical protein